MSGNKHDGAETYSKEILEGAQAEEKEERAEKVQPEIKKEQTQEAQPVEKEERLQKNEQEVPIKQAQVQGTKQTQPEVKETEVFSGNIEDGLKKFAEEAMKETETGDAGRQKERTSKHKKKDSKASEEVEPYRQKKSVSPIKFKENTPEETEKKEETPKKKKVLKTLLLIMGSFLLILVAIYAGASFFFTSHYYLNTEINGMDFSAKTPADVQRALNSQVEGYSLKVLEKDGESDTILAGEIGLTYEKSDDVEQILERQNPLLWVKAFWEKNTEEVEVRANYDTSYLELKMNSLKAFHVERVEPVSAYPRYDGEQFVIEPEKTGTDVNEEVLREKLAEYIKEFRPELNMEEENCYVLPRYTSESQEVKDACDEMNRYLRASITYTMDEDVVVDKELISQWVSIDENLTVTFHDEKVREWLEAFGDKYDTVATTRSITTPTGKTAEVSGGTYGWGIDEDTEFEALINSIKNGEVVRKEPAYYPNQTAASHGPQDWGDTYAEVDIGAQHMWLIKGGSVILESDVVTGKPIPSMETTTGVFTILEKSRNTTLVGEIDPATGQPAYRTPVSFWMRITWSGIGFHDATWQAAFGGTRYRDGWGSHGCVNMPWDKASELFDLIEVGTPVILHN